MFRTPFAGIRVPDVDDVDIPAAVTAMLTDVEFELRRYDGLIETVNRQTGVSVYDGGAIALPNAVYTNCTFAGVNWDTGNYFNPLAPAGITLPPGVWLITGCAIIVGGGVLSTAHLRLFGSVSGYIATNSGGPFSAAGNVTQSVTGLYAIPASQTITLACYQRSAGAGSIAASQILAAKICAL